jgi:hypothetical protein
MTRFLPLTMLFLLGCPVEPKDIQDLNNQGPGKPDGQMGGQAGMGQAGNGQGAPQGNGNQGNGNGQGGNIGGPPPGAPTGNEQAQGPLPTGDMPEGSMPNGDMPNGNMPNGNMMVEGNGQGDLPPGQMPNGNNGGLPEGGTPPQGNGDTVPSLPLGEGEQIVVDENGTPQFQNAPIGDVPAQPGAHGDVKTPEGTHPTPDFAHQPGEIPATAGDVLPMYQQAPTFADFMGDEQITIELSVSGATAFDFEFVVKREGDGRVYPKVIHKQSDATSPVTITAPATMDEPVWLVITADNTGDGPTPDDLVGGTTEALLFAGSNMSLSYSLEADDAFMQSLPWFSQAQGSDGPEFER